METNREVLKDLTGKIGDTLLDLGERGKTMVSEGRCGPAPDLEHVEMVGGLYTIAAMIGAVGLTLADALARLEQERTP